MHSCAIPAFYREENDVARASARAARYFRPRQIRDVRCGNFSYGDQRRLEIVRALATKPELLLLDEPAAGMNPREKEQLMELIKFVKKKFEIAVLLVEHDMKVVMGICERIRGARLRNQDRRRHARRKCSANPKVMRGLPRPGSDAQRKRADARCLS